MSSDAGRETPNELRLGKRDAVRHESGNTVTHSVPVLKEPTLSARASRKLDASPAAPQGANLRPVFQPKSGRGLGQSPISAEGAVPPALDSADIRILADFFVLVDTWERTRNDKESCSECGVDAELSLCQILSTVGRTPRSNAAAPPPLSVLPVYKAG